MGAGSNSRKYARSHFGIVSETCSCECNHLVSSCAKPLFFKFILSFNSNYITKVTNNCMILFVQLYSSNERYTKLMPTFSAGDTLRLLTDDYDYKNLLLIVQPKPIFVKYTMLNVVRLVHKHSTKTKLNDSIVLIHRKSISPTIRRTLNMSASVLAKRRQTNRLLSLHQKTTQTMNRSQRPRQPPFSTRISRRL